MLGLGLALLVALPQTTALAADVAFPDAPPESVGLDAAALQRLTDVVRGFVERDEIVGAELVVIAQRKTVWRAAVGWTDRDRKVPMPTGGIFCVRSMTKPVCSTAIQMLVDRGEIALTDRIADHFHAFDHGKAAEITLQQLLEHTGGLPLSQFLRRPLGEATGLLEMADVAGEFGPTHEPGSRFVYSDDGADTLGALVEQISEQTLDRFLETELFAPLGMRDAIGVLTPEEPRLARVHGLYFGGQGNWTRVGEPGRPPLFKFLLASQGLYCSIDDYARFLALWMDGGLRRDPEQRLLSAAAVARALRPASARSGIPSGFDGWQLHYGQFWMVWIDPARPAAEQPAAAADTGGFGDIVAFGDIAAFGHNGSDGTFAYAFPRRDLMVFYFTQSRQQRTGTAFEAALKRELLGAPAAKEAPAGR